MVFGADGVFADNTQQATSAPGNPNATLLGALENVVVTALARGTATALQYREGTIVQAPPVNGQFARTATVNLSSGTTAGLTSTMYMASFQIANVPMSPVIPGGSPTSTFTVTSPLPIPPTAGDLLTFSQFYPDGGTWSAFAAFLHNNAGYSVMIDGRAYALPFDDQGGFSSDLNAATSPTAPAAVTITMGAWSPAVSSVRRIGDDLLITGTDAVDVIRILPTRFGELLVLRNGRSLGAYAAARRIIIDGLGGNDVLSTFRGRARIPSTIRGGAGHDRLFGGPGDDVLIGGPGRNRLFGGAGRNRLVHGDAVDPLPVRRPWFTLWRDRQLAARGREDRSVK
jgi:Ca2+-binding RTX toxin-like protein